MNRSRILALAPLFGAIAQGALAQTTATILNQSRADQRPVIPSYRSKPSVTRSRIVVATAGLFQLNAVTITGAASVEKAKLAAIYALYLGKMVGTAELSTLSNHIAGFYEKNSGLALYSVEIPKQDFADGTVKIVVTEGYIQGVRVTGQGGRRDYGLLKAYGEALTRERPLRRATLERYVSLIRDLPGLNPTLSFVQGSAPGALELVISIKPRLADLAVSLNNRGTAYLGRNQVELDVGLHGLFREGDDTRLTAASPTDLKRFRYYSVSHIEPLGSDGVTAQLNFGYLITRPSFYDLHGHATSFGLQLNAPLLRSYSQNLFLTAGFDGLNSDNALFGQTLSSDRTRAARLALTYTRQSKRYYLLVNGAFSAGIRGLGARVLDPRITTLDFKKYNMRLTANIALVRDLVLRLNGAVLYSPDRLPGGEQFALGGEDFGRAYEAAAVAGDRGYAGSTELAWKLTRFVPAELKDSELYAFADGGQTDTLARAGLSPLVRRALASVGSGARVAVGSKAVVQVEASRGLYNPVPTEEHEDWRAICSIKTQF